MDYEKIILLPNEYKVLKKAAHSKKHTAPKNNKEWCKILFDNKLLEYDSAGFDEVGNELLSNIYRITDNGRRYLIWYRRYCWKSYYPVAISFISLAVSVIYPIIDYIFRN